MSARNPTFLFLYLFLAFILASSPAMAQASPPGAAGTQCPAAMDTAAVLQLELILHQLQEQNADLARNVAARQAETDRLRAELEGLKTYTGFPEPTESQPGFSRVPTALIPVAGLALYLLVTGFPIARRREENEGRADA